MLSPLLVYFALAPSAPFTAPSCSCSCPAQPSWGKGWRPQVIHHGVTSLLVWFLSLRISELIFLRVLITGEGSVEGLRAHTSAGGYWELFLVSISIDRNARRPWVVGIGSGILGIRQTRRKSKSLLQKTGDDGSGAWLGCAEHLSMPGAPAGRAADARRWIAGVLNGSALGLGTSQGALASCRLAPGLSMAPSECPCGVWDGCCWAQPCWFIFCPL